MGVSPHTYGIRVGERPKEKQMQRLVCEYLVASLEMGTHQQVRNGRRQTELTSARPAQPCPHTNPQPKGRHPLTLELLQVSTKCRKAAEGEEVEGEEVEGEEVEGEEVAPVVGWEGVAGDVTVVVETNGEWQRVQWQQRQQGTTQGHTILTVVPPEGDSSRRRNLQRHLPASNRVSATAFLRAIVRLPPKCSLTSANKRPTTGPWRRPRRLGWTAVPSTMAQPWWVGPVTPVRTEI